VLNAHNLDCRAKYCPAIQAGVIYDQIPGLLVPSYQTNTPKTLHLTKWQTVGSFH